MCIWLSAHEGFPNFFSLNFKIFWKNYIYCKFKVQTLDEFVLEGRSVGRGQLYRCFSIWKSWFLGRFSGNFRGILFPIFFTMEVMLRNVNTHMICKNKFWLSILFHWYFPFFQRSVCHNSHVQERLHPEGPLRGLHDAAVPAARRNQYRYLFQELVGFFVMDHQ